MASENIRNGLITDLFGLAFAAIWASRAAHAALLSPILTIALIAPVTLLFAAGFFYRDQILKRPEQVWNAPLLKRTKTLRAISIFLMVTAVQSTHHPELLYPLLGGIIGLSYVGTGKAMHEPVHIVTGTAIVLISAASFFLPEPLHLELAGAGTAVALWVGCAFRLKNSLQTIPPQPAPTFS